MFEATSESISFAEFELDRAHRRLLKDGEPVQLFSKTFDLLNFLIERNGQVVTKDEIFDNVWPGQILEEANLSVQVSALRKALGEQKGSPRFLVTIPGKGYRLTIPLTDTTARAVIVENREYSRIVVEEEETVSSDFTNGALVARMSSSTKLAIAIGALVAALTVFLGAYFYLREQPNGEAFANLRFSRVTNNGDVAGAALSPDGKYVAYVLQEEGGYSLRLRQPGTAADVEVLPAASGEFWGLTFSPDGRFIYYNLFTSGKANIEVYRVPTLGGMPEKLPKVISHGIAFSPDGTEIAYVQSDSGSNANHLVVAKSDGREPTIIASRQYPDTFQFEGRAVAWSPNGRSIESVVKHSGVGGTYCSIVQVDRLSGEERTFDESRWRGIGRLEWLPDGSGLVVTGTDNVSGTGKIWMLPSDGGPARPLISDLNEYAWTSVAGNGRSFATVQTTSESGIWVADLGSDDFREIASEVGNTHPIVWPSDSSLVYRSMKDGRPNLWAISSDGSGSRQLTTSGAVDMRGMCSINGGSHIVFASTSNGRTDLWSVASDGTDLIQRSDGEVDGYPQCAADGSTVIFQRGIYLSPRLWSLSLATGEQKPLGDVRAKWPALAPNGSHLAFFYLSDSTWDLVIADAGDLGETARIKVPKNHSESRIIWVSEDEIFYIGREGSAENIWSLSIPSGSGKKITAFTENSIADFALSPDRRQLAVVRTRTQSDVVLAESVPGN